MQEAIADKEAKKGKEVNPDSISPCCPTSRAPTAGAAGNEASRASSNMMLKTSLGVIEDEWACAACGPETAQGVWSCDFLGGVPASRGSRRPGVAQTRRELAQRDERAG